MPKKGRLLTFWDECKLVEDELSDRKNELAAEIQSGEITEEEIEHQVWRGQLPPAYRGGGLSAGVDCWQAC